MLTNDFFDINRFRMLCKKDLMENWKTMLLRLVMLYASLAVVFCFICYWDCDSVLSGDSTGLSKRFDSYYSVAGILFFIFGFFLASFTFEAMRSKIKRISYLMTPSTMFEKFFSRFLLVVPIYIGIFLFSFQLADYTRVLLFSIFYPNIDIFPIGLNNFVGSESAYFSAWSNFFSALASMFFIQSIFALGSIIWFKKVAIKVVACLVALYMLFFVVNGTLIHLLFDSGMNDFFESLSRYTWFIDNHTWSVYCTILFSFLGVMNWVITYYRFKESEIINRV